MLLICKYAKLLLCVKVFYQNEKFDDINIPFPSTIFFSMGSVSLLLFTSFHLPFLICYFLFPFHYSQNFPNSIEAIFYTSLWEKGGDVRKIWDMHFHTLHRLPDQMINLSHSISFTHNSQHMGSLPPQKGIIGKQSRSYLPKATSFLLLWCYIRDCVYKRLWNKHYISDELTRFINHSFGSMIKPVFKKKNAPLIQLHPRKLLDFFRKHFHLISWPKGNPLKLNHLLIWNI